MTTTELTPVPEGCQPLFLSFAIALPLLDGIGWMASSLAPASGAIAARPDSGAPATLLYAAGASVLIGLLFCVFSLARRESLRALGVICLIAYIVPIALVLSHIAQAH